LTEKGREIRRIVADLFARHAERLGQGVTLDRDSLRMMNTSLKGLERFWTDQIRYIY